MYLFLGNLVWRYRFKHGVYKWGHEYSHIDFSWEYFLVCNFFIFQRPQQLVSWNMDALKLIKRNYNLQTRIRFQESHVTKMIKLLTKFIFQRVSKYKFRFYNCVESVQIRSYFWSVFSCIWTEYWDLCNKIINTGKFGPEITPYLDTFHAVIYCREIFKTESSNK